MTRFLRSWFRPFFGYNLGLPKPLLRGFKKMPDNQTTRTRLDSWKDIASYLNRHQRTVIRWEKKNGLPVRRGPGGSVFAYTDEIDAWLVGQTSDNIASAPAEMGEHIGGVGSRENGYCTDESVAVQGQLGSTPDRETKGKSSVSHALEFKPWKFAGAILLGLLSVFGVIRVFVPRSPAVTLRPFRFAQITDDGRF